MQTACFVACVEIRHLKCDFSLYFIYTVKDNFSFMPLMFI